MKTTQQISLYINHNMLQQWKELATLKNLTLKELIIFAMDYYQNDKLKLSKPIKKQTDEIDKTYEIEKIEKTAEEIEAEEIKKYKRLKAKEKALEEMKLYKEKQLAEEKERKRLKDHKEITENLKRAQKRMIIAKEIHDGQ